MSEISDELRSLADDMEMNPGVAQRFSPKSLRRLACRIDNAMVEWPLGADKKRIKPGQTVYDPCGGEWDVTGVVFPIIPGIALVTLEHDGTEITRFSVDLTHERPDSWERISQELEELSVDSMVGDIDLLSSCALGLAKRIRRLAKKEGEQCQ